MVVVVMSANLINKALTWYIDLSELDGTSVCR